MRLLFAIIALLAFASPASATGFIEGIILYVLTAAGVSGAALGIATTALTAAVVIGVSVGLNFLASALFAPSQNAPRPEDMQQSSRQPTQPRARHYGRVKVSGPWVFAEAKDGEFHKVLAIGQGPIDGVEETWIDDSRVTLKQEGIFADGVWADRGRMLYRLGEPSETHYSTLTAHFPEWTSSHRGDGVASVYVRQYGIPQEAYLQTYPNGINTNYRLVIRGAKVKNPTTDVVEWNDRAAAVIRDYMTHQDGMRLPEGIFTTPAAQAGWDVAYSRSTEVEPTKDGGAEARYRLWGSYLLNERPADVLGRMLECCDGRLVPTPDGGLTLNIGAWAEPSVTIDQDAIVGFTDLSRGRDILTSANTIRATFLDPGSDYQAAEAEPWVDAEDVSIRGEIPIDKRFEMAPSHSQCRRLMKLAAYRANPRWIGTFKCNLRALAAFGERFVRIQYPLFGINEVFEVQDFRFDIGPGGILQGVTLSVQSMPQAAYQWDPEQEEGEAPVADESEGAGAPTPGAPVVTIIAGPAAEIAFSPSPSEIYRYQARYKPTAGDDDAWVVIEEIPIGDTSVETDTLDAETEYEFQVRLISVAQGIPGAWSDSTIEETP